MLGDSTKLLWDACKVLRDHDIAVIAWALLVDSGVQDDVSKRLSRERRNVIEGVIAKFYVEELTVVGNR